MRSKEQLHTVWLHTHTRLDKYLVDFEQRRLEYETHEGQFSCDALVWLAQNFTQNQSVLIGDTDHPVHILDRLGIKRKGSFAKTTLRRTREYLNSGVYERASLLNGSPIRGNVLTGVEADILSSDGLLDVDDSTLSVLDIVIASFHPR